MTVISISKGFWLSKLARLLSLAHCTTSEGEHPVFDKTLPKATNLQGVQPPCKSQRAKLGCSRAKICLQSSIKYKIIFPEIMSYSLLKKVSLRSLGTIDEIRSWYLNKNTLIGGRYKRVFQFHIRKTGGRSLSLAFFALSGLSPEAVKKNKDQSVLKRVVVNGMVFGARGKSEIENGNYFYASSHLPSHKLSGSFRLTMINY